MNKNEFWNLIDEVNQETDNNDRDGILKATQTKLLEYPLQDIVDFHNYLMFYQDLANTPPIEAAAIVINDGISDDGFLDFRAWLVSKGKDIYTNALKSGDSLADVAISSEPYATEFEFYGYIASYAYELKSFLEQKGIKEIDGNGFFSLKQKGKQLVQNYLYNRCTYNNPLRETKDPLKKELLKSIDRQLNFYNVYDAAVASPFNEQQKKEIQEELEYEPEYGQDELQQVLPRLYKKFKTPPVTKDGAPEPCCNCECSYDSEYDETGKNTMGGI